MKEACLERGELFLRPAWDRFFPIFLVFHERKVSVVYRSIRSSSIACAVGRVLIDLARSITEKSGRLGMIDLPQTTHHWEERLKLHYIWDSEISNIDKHCVIQWRCIWGRNWRVYIGESSERTWQLNHHLRKRLNLLGQPTNRGLFRDIRQEDRVREGSIERLKRNTRRMRTQEEWSMNRRGK
jgi:hypothetical protein